MKYDTFLITSFWIQNIFYFLFKVINEGIENLGKQFQAGLIITSNLFSDLLSFY